MVWLKRPFSRVANLAKPAVPWQPLQFASLEEYAGWLAERAEWVADPLGGVIDSFPSLGHAAYQLLATGKCSLQLGTDQVCWRCREAPAETLPPPEPSAQNVETPAVVPLCREILTPEVTGQDAWDRYRIAELLKGDRFQRHPCVDSDCVICYADRMLGAARVEGDELYYRIDARTGELVMERIHWRGDLPQQLPSPLISQQEAEALVEGRVESSYLAFPSIDHPALDVSKPASRTPCWHVSSHTVDEKGIEYPWVTVIDALTEQILGRYAPS